MSDFVSDALPKKGLNKCPNCGWTVVKMLKTIYPKELRRHYVECDRCHWCGAGAITERGAIRKWNKGKPDGCGGVND